MGSGAAAGDEAGETAAPPASDPVVALAGVGKVFPPAASGAAPLRALEGIDLAVGRGAIVSLIGPSGCGKSTLLRLVAGSTDPSEGRILVAGKAPEAARRDRDIGMVFQSPVLFDWRSVRANVELPLELAGLPRAERETRADGLLELVELAGFGRHRPWQLSGGMAQRAAIARALALDPALLLMDEPFGALDEMTRERMQLELLRIRARTGTTVLFVTHSIAEAVFLSTRVVVLDGGGGRPGRIAATIEVDLPPARDVGTREDPRYYALVTEVREALRGRAAA